MSTGETKVPLGVQCTRVTRGTPRGPLSPVLPPCKPKLPQLPPKCPYLGTHRGTFQRLERQNPGAGPLLPSAGGQLGHLFVPFSHNFSKILSLYRRPSPTFPIGAFICPNVSSRLRPLSPVRGGGRAGHPSLDWRDQSAPTARLAGRPAGQTPAALGFRGAARPLTVAFRAFKAVRSPGYQPQ